MNTLGLHEVTEDTSGRKAQNIMESVPQRKHVLSEFQRNEFNLWAAESEDLVQVPGTGTLERDVFALCAIKALPAEGSPVC